MCFGIKGLSQLTVVTRMTDALGFGLLGWASAKAGL
jgi:hypothetical protein